MSASSHDADVCVVGGGPAGAALACRLAMFGHSVVVVERRPFPRPHIGESVSPGVWPLAELLGARAAIEAADFPRAVEARVRWGAPEARRSTVAEPGLGVDRGSFDQLLLERAGEAGATIVQPASARRPLTAEGGWEVPVITGEGSLTVRARFVADASGRARLLGGHRRNTSPRTVALHALWRGIAGDEGQTLVEAQPQSWLWGAHLPGGRFRAIAFLDPELIRRRRRAGDDVESLYRELLGGSSLFGELIAAARIEGRVIACDATCYCDDDPIGAGWAKIGEAGFAIDPLSSSGVQVAIQTGVTAGVAIRTILCEDGDAEAASAFFREHQRHAVERHTSLSADLYRSCAAYSAEPFWRRRCKGAPAQPPIPASAVALEGLLQQRVRLCRGSALVPTPCVVRDRVESRRALSHPALPRPVAYLAGHELAPLLDRLDGKRTLHDAVEDWTGSVSAGTAYAIASWLAANGLLTPAASGQPDPLKETQVRR